jgi:ferritin
MKKLLTSQEVEMMNNLGNLEMVASHTYKHLANSMKTIGFFGAEKFFNAECLSELEHYDKLEAFMNDMNEQLEVHSLDAIDDEIGDLMQAFTHALEMEADLLEEYEFAWEKSSPKVKSFLQELIDIQVHSVGEYGDLIARLSRTSEPILVDQELGK